MGFFDGLKNSLAVLIATNTSAISGAIGSALSTAGSAVAAAAGGVLSAAGGVLVAGTIRFIQQ